MRGFLTLFALILSYVPASAYVRYHPAGLAKMEPERYDRDLTLLYYLDGSGNFIYQAFCPRDTVAFTPTECLPPAYYISLAAFRERVLGPIKNQLHAARVLQASEYGDASARLVHYQELLVRTGDSEYEKEVNRWKKRVGELGAPPDPKRVEEDGVINEERALEQFIREKLQPANRGFKESSIVFN